MHKRSSHSCFTPRGSLALHVIVVCTTMYKDTKKYSRTSNERPSHRYKKRRFSGNRYTKKNEEEHTNTSAKKLAGSDDFSVTVTPDYTYSIINIGLIFSALSNIIKCKTCDGNITFGKKNEQGLGFKLVVQCNCGETSINSCPQVNGKAYEINLRIVFVMRLLGVGLQGLDCFCAMMDIGTGINIKSYYATVEKIFTATKAIFDAVIKKAGREEKEKNSKAGNKESELIVSGDGSWSKRGFSSLFGVITLVGHYSNKVLDLVVKSSFCRACISWKNKKDTPEYEEWLNAHNDNCSANHTGSAGKMEVDGMLEMFARADDLHSANYKTYIGDGDTKTFKALVEQDSEVKKKECVNHVQKRMGARLRNAKKSNKNIGGRGSGKLTDNLIKDLTVYYGLAIRRNPDSVEDMINATWATFEHKISTNKNPKHERCPPGPDSWCNWRRAEDEGTLKDFEHPPPLDPKVQEVLRPIYTDLSSRDLLSRCCGGYTQNNNECFNKTIWQFAPKHIFYTSMIIEISAYIAACIFNEGFKPLLKIMELMGIKVGMCAQMFAETRDEKRIRHAERRTSSQSKEERMARREERLHELQHLEEAEGIFYSPGIDD